MHYSINGYEKLVPKKKNLFYVCLSVYSQRNLNWTESMENWSEILKEKILGRHLYILRIGKKTEENEKRNF